MHIMVQNVFMYLDSIVCNLLLLGLKVSHTERNTAYCIVSVFCSFYKTVQPFVMVTVLSSYYNTTHCQMSVLCSSYIISCCQLYVLCSSYNTVQPFVRVFVL